MFLAFESAGLSDKGITRSKNEDAWQILEEEMFFALADGMGGHQAGEIAAQKAISAVCELIQDYHFSLAAKQQKIGDLPKVLELALKQANQQVYEMSLENEHLEGMGTTLCCLCLTEGFATIAHVGDSRVYRLRDKDLDLLTEDHSLLMELIASGQLTTEKEQKSFRRKHVITRAIGTSHKVRPTIATLNLHQGDTFILCSDGLSDFVSEDLIKEILLKDDNLDSLCQHLVKKAKALGSRDDITVLVVKYKGVME